ncbi:hypothetical protein Pth03_47590 [Planotetraspora thailandica]|uniref:Uncharacterized protein n=1 Tax=Planotetraspora thailandica TaxID=487172 RepID=A0A8J3VE70_9ACTN|nr:hypothetical protein Pth03_47590 [Planotetraspora thailandica]
MKRPCGYPRPGAAAGHAIVDIRCALHTGTGKLPIKHPPCLCERGKETTPFPLALILRRPRLGPPLADRAPRATGFAAASPFDVATITERDPWGRSSGVKE